MFISKGCLNAILENLSVLNREVEILKKAVSIGGNSTTANDNTIHLKNGPNKDLPCYHSQDQIDSIKLCKRRSKIDICFTSSSLTVLVFARSLEDFEFLNWRYRLKHNDPPKETARSLLASKMKIKASDLKPGQVVELEYGAAENWTKFIVDQVIKFDKMVTVKCHSKNINTDFYTDFSCEPDEMVVIR